MQHRDMTDPPIKTVRHYIVPFVGLSATGSHTATTTEEASNAFWAHETPTTQTHDNQCAKNKQSLPIFCELIQAEVTVTAMRVAATRMGVMYSSPGCKPITTKSLSHVDEDTAMGVPTAVGKGLRNGNVRSSDEGV